MWTSISIGRWCVRGASSLHDEVKNFPLQQWGRNAVLVASSALVLLLLLIYIPLNLPLTLSMARLQGAQKVEVTSVQALEATPLRIGDTLKVRGSGMCYVPPPANGAAPSILRRSTAPASTGTTPPHCRSRNRKSLTKRRPCWPRSTASCIRAAPIRRSTRSWPAPSKSGMILLDDFSDIVLKTQNLCGRKRLRAVEERLVSTGNAKTGAAR